MPRTGAPQRDICTRGHDMTETRKRYSTNGESYCSACKKIREDTWRKDPSTLPVRRARSRRSRNKVRYGLSQEDYDGLLAAQVGVCAVCEGPRGLRDFHVDHDHETGVVRGLLCHACNTAIGLLREDPALLQAAADYLSKPAKKAGKSSTRKRY